MDLVKLLILLKTHSQARMAPDIGVFQPFEEVSEVEAGTRHSPMISLVTRQRMNAS